MRRFLLLITLVVVVFTSTVVLAKSSSPILNPQISAIEAIIIAQEFFYNKETRIIDGETFKLKDYVLISARYTNNFDDKTDKEWGWKIEFLHPVQNDHSLLYKITNDKKVIFLHASE